MGISKLERQKRRIGNKFLDKDNKIWKISKFENDIPILWNEKTGWGLWDNGRDLTFLSD